MSPNLDLVDIIYKPVRFTSILTNKKEYVISIPPTKIGLIVWWKNISVIN